MSSSEFKSADPAVLVEQFLDILQAFQEGLEEDQDGISVEEARQQIRALGPDLPQVLIKNHLITFAKTFGLPSGGLKDQLVRQLVQWIIPNESPEGTGRDAKHHAEVGSVSDKDPDSDAAPLNMILEKLEQNSAMLNSFSGRLAVIEKKSPTAGRSVSSEDDWAEHLERDAHKALDQSGFHVDESSHRSRLPRRRVTFHREVTVPSRSRSIHSSRPNRPLLISRDGGGRRTVSSNASRRNVRHGPYPSRVYEGNNRQSFLQEEPRRVHASGGVDYMSEDILHDTYARFNSLRARVDHGKWNSEKLRREALTLAVIADLYQEDRREDAMEVLLRRLVAVEYADAKGGRKQHWNVARKLESSLTMDRLWIDPVSMRHALKLSKLEHSGDEESTGSSGEDKKGQNGKSRPAKGHKRG